jgi:hypothetical protein
MISLKLQIKIFLIYEQDFSGVRMSERFPVRKGISASLRERLGDLGNKPAMSPPRKENDNRRTSENERNKTKDVSNKRLSGARGYHSGDSLEMDQGDDLRGELDGQHAANMVIQVLSFSFFIKAKSANS